MSEPYTRSELAELRRLHEDACDDSECSSQRLYATIDRLRDHLPDQGHNEKTIRTLQAGFDALVAENERLRQYAKDCGTAMVTSPMAQENERYRAALESVGCLRPMSSSNPHGVGGQAVTACGTCEVCSALGDHPFSETGRDDDCSVCGVMRCFHV
jgi:hypothetical protein